MNSVRLTNLWIPIALVWVFACGGQKPEAVTTPPDAEPAASQEVTAPPSEPEAVSSDVDEPVAVAPDTVPDETPVAEDATSEVTAAPAEEPAATPAAAAAKETAPAAKLNKGPAKITMPAKKGAVVFPHRAHQSETGCRTCHHTMEKGVTPPSCDSCHGKGQGPSMSVVSHKVCKNCHQKNGMPVDCASCHGG